MTKPTWTDVAHGIQDVGTSELIERMAHAADANESTPVHWHSDDDVRHILRHLASCRGLSAERSRDNLDMLARKAVAALRK